jgi:hypothetical protein
MAVTHTTAHRIVTAVLCVVGVALASAGCSSIMKPPATQCPELVGWPPAGLPSPPASVVVAHPPNSAVKVTNFSDAPIKFRYTVWTPLDCDLLPAGTFAASVLAPGNSATWSPNDLVPASGPVLGGIEVWTRQCDETCGDPPDAFVSFELPKPSR